MESSLLFESVEEICARVFKQLRPRTAPPAFRVEFRQFANPDSFARYEDGVITLRITDLLAGAPAPVLEALIFMLFGKLLRRPVAPAYAHRYRLYMNRRDMTRQIHLIRQIRGRKFISGPQGDSFNLDEIFEELNRLYFGGLMARPQLGWSRNASRTTLGHYDPSHNAIVLNRILDRAGTPRLAVEFVLYHEMLHLRFPAEARGGKRQVHTTEFRKAEREFAKLRDAKELLKRLAARA